MKKKKTRKQMATEYGVCRKTFYRMLKRANINPPARKLISPTWQEKIYDYYGRPTKDGKKQMGLE